MSLKCQTKQRTGEEDVRIGIFLFKDADQKVLNGVFMCDDVKLKYKMRLQVLRTITKEFLPMIDPALIRRKAMKRLKFTPRFSAFELFGESRFFG